MLILKANMTFCHEVEPGQYKLGLTTPQLHELAELLYLIHLRTKFFDEQGYMASDDFIKIYYKDKE